MEIIEAIKSGEKIRYIQERFGFSFNTINSIIRKHQLQQYQKTATEFAIKKKLIKLVYANPNKLCEIEIAEKIGIDRAKVIRIAKTAKIMDLIKSHKLTTKESKIAKLNSIDFKSRIELIQKAKKHNIADQLIADKLGVCKQRVNQLRLRYGII